MKIAIPTASGLLCPHFGHCEEFVLIDVEPDTRRVLNKQHLVPPPHEPGLLPRWLHQQGANVIIAGGMGQRAVQLFAQNGVQVVVGAPVGDPDEIAMSYLAGTLKAGENVCDH
ncbi:MAG TPA: NifB/NifX family molybdenum-iron cluster-binding protein [Phycisphaerae bacterium]|nr:NifB/NifX family molybdenum-iron cluster-binding protein [Phycisphaerae bacterium]HOM53784.1 NifB/NifX family molybdenum-iron cluster-binding protein [Phycisphaerae bacterium]HON67923.1 NifB/NifX family molybdenum-iron cluster-binding protein [Phycisphaerae bacterium]HPP29201.1 NifB/NifX family molybdenum-iron cluster-binding protein [Phycisphaerae bacterium]HPZ96953.1 NifB/NifX family molybdenum-iron cluster-binding protein [Phycisphaerae bacterium]